MINILLILTVIMMTALIILKSIQKKQNAEVDEKIDETIEILKDECRYLKIVGRY